MRKLDLLCQKQTWCVPVRSDELWAVVLPSESKARNDDDDDDDVNYGSVGTNVNSLSNQGNRRLEKTKENPWKQMIRIKANIYSFKHKNKFNWLKMLSSPMVIKTEIH